MDRGRKFIQMIPVICCSSFEYCQPLGAVFFSQGFYHKCGPQCRALEIEKLKVPLLRGPEGPRAGATNDWCKTTNVITGYSGVGNKKTAISIVFVV